MNHRLTAFLLAFCLLIEVPAYADAALVTWVSPETGATWSAYRFSERASLVEMKRLCADRGQQLPDTEPAEAEADFFAFMSGPLGPDVEEFPHFMFRGVDVRLFPYINRVRKDERYRSSQEFHTELRDYFRAVHDFCVATGSGDCQASLDNMNAIDQKMAQQTEYHGQAGFMSMFVDALGDEASLEELEQEYENFRVQKPSYETARTVLISKDEPRLWSGLICVEQRR